MKKIFLPLICVLVACGCNKETNNSGQDSGQIRFNLGYSTKADRSGFQEGDVVSLFAVEYIDENTPGPLQIGGNYFNNSALVKGTSGWSAETPLYWSDKPCDFYAWYPYTSINSVDNFIFDIQLDQDATVEGGTMSGYEASDLMFAKATKVAREDGEVNLPFKHMMSRCNVVLIKGETFEGEIPDDAVAHIYNTVTSAKVDFTQGTLQRYAYGTHNTITMNKINNSTFRSIVVPQNVETRTPLIEVTVSGISYLLDYSISFKPGCQHTINVTLNVSPDQEKLEIKIDGSVEGWD